MGRERRRGARAERPGRPGHDRAPVPRPPSTTPSRGRHTGNRKPGTRNPLPLHLGANRSLRILCQGYSKLRRTPSRRYPSWKLRAPRLADLAPLTMGAPRGWMSCRPARMRLRAGSTRSGQSLKPAASTPRGSSGRPRPSRRLTGRRKRPMRWKWSCRRSGRAGIAGVTVTDRAERKRSSFAPAPAANPAPYPICDLPRQGPGQLRNSHERGEAASAAALALNRQLPYSRGVQQPGCTTAVMHGHRHPELAVWMGPTLDAPVVRIERISR